MSVPQTNPTTVGSVMTPTLITVRPTTPVKTIMRLLRAHRISAVAVLDAFGAPIGVVSEADIVTRLAAKPRLLWSWSHVGKARRQRGRATGFTARDLMTAPVRTIDVAAPVGEAAAQLTRGDLRRLFVVSGRALVGVLSRSDLLHLFDRADADIRWEVDMKISYDALTSELAELYVDVTDGIVTLIGAVGHRSEALRAQACAESTSGVIGVRNRLSFQVDDTRGNGVKATAEA